MKSFPLSREGLKRVRVNPALAGVGQAKATCPSLGDSACGPEGPLSAATTTCAALRRGPRLRLCAPPKTLRTLQPPPARFSLPAARRQVLRAAFPQPPLPCFGLQTFLLLSPIPTQGLPSRLRECGAGPVVGRQCRRSVPNDHFACPGNAVGVDWPRGRPRPARPPRASYPGAGGCNTFSYLPASKDHTLRSALLIHPPAAEEGKRALLLFPGAGWLVWGQDAREMPRSWVSRTGDAHPRQLCQQQERR